jgi:hypothetical protein
VGSRFSSPYGKHVYDILREFAMTWVTEHCDRGYGGRRVLYGAAPGAILCGATSCTIRYGTERDYFF